jgi:rhodanese-related sulfurtransferase
LSRASALSPQRSCFWAAAVAGLPVVESMGSSQQPRRRTCLPSSLDVSGALIRRLLFPHVQHMECAALRQLLDAARTSSGAHTVALLDTREAAEFAVSHILGAVRVDPDAHTSPEAVRALLPDLGGGDSATFVVCYCSIGFRSSQLASALATHWPEGAGGGVHNLDGSIFQWVTDGYELVDLQGHATARVHTYSGLFGKMLAPEHRSRGLPAGRGGVETPLKAD